MNINKEQSHSLSKYLAQSGIASRRKIVDVIKSKIVTVNSVVVSEPGFRVHKNDCIRVNGVLVRAESKVYLLINKPKNCITTVSDDLGRHAIMDLISQEVKQRVYPIGRLDRNTTGLLVVTNDGDMALKLSHPRFEIQKIYHLQLDKALTKKDRKQILNGIELEDGLVHFDQVMFLEGRSKNNVSVSLHSGKYRIIRRVFEYLGYEVVKLDRVYYAGLSKSGLKVGQWRHLTSAEISYLKQQS